METVLAKTNLGGNNKVEDGHGIGFLLSDSSKYPITEEYEIPPKYDIDTIVALPVNEDKIFVYWELTENLLLDRLQNPAASYFTIKVYEINAGEKKGNIEKEIWTTQAEEPLGEVYMPCSGAFRPMVAVIGVERDSGFIELLRSNQINIPSFKVLGLKDELWGKGVLIPDEEKITEKPKVISEIEKASDISDIFEKEMGIVSQLLDIRFKDSESIEVILALIEKLKHLSGNEKTMLDLIKQFFETRTKDIQLLSLFIDFIKFMSQRNKVKDEESLSVTEYFEKLKEAAGMPGSSEMLSSKRS
ncbi:MAG: DUF4912 domain-containing protein [Nitrospirae bacterium]|nr:DUF4912 domain-containing protein [Nitrospirota bacterium]